MGKSGKERKRRKLLQVSLLVLAPSRLFVRVCQKCEGTAHTQAQRLTEVSLQEQTQLADCLSGDDDDDEPTAAGVSIAEAGRMFVCSPSRTLMRCTHASKATR